MTSLRRAVGATERLDTVGHARADLEESLDHVAAVNRWLGGRRALLRHLEAVWPDRADASILDVGTGSADLPRAICAWARRTGRIANVVACDRHPQILAVARARCAGDPRIRFVRADALALPHPDRAFDIVLLSLTLHHFDDVAQVEVLRELGRVARLAVLVGELERCWPNYLGARVLAATLWRGNAITRHDGPLSVLRAFTPAELLATSRAAGFGSARVYRHPFYRLVLRAEPQASRGAVRPWP